jgi:hypothetical protein
MFLILKENYVNPLILLLQKIRSEATTEMIEEELEKKSEQ